MVTSRGKHIDVLDLKKIFKVTGISVIQSSKSNRILRCDNLKIEKFESQIAMTTTAATLLADWKFSFITTNYAVFTLQTRLYRLIGRHDIVQGNKEPENMNKLRSENSQNTSMALVSPQLALIPWIHIFTWNSRFYIFTVCLSPWAIACTFFH